MALSSGHRIGNYEVIGPAGAGGMGEVYRARDSRLERTVAIKALPSGVAGDTTRLTRFEREAKVLASLNHPNIAAIYGIEDASGGPYLVLEFVEGETLAQRLARGQPETASTLLNRALTTRSFLPVAHRLEHGCHPLLDQDEFGPRKAPMTLVWPLQAPMIDEARYALFEDVRIKSARPESTSLLEKVPG